MGFIYLSFNSPTLVSLLEIETRIWCCPASLSEVAMKGGDPAGDRGKTFASNTSFTSAGEEQATCQNVPYGTAFIVLYKQHLAHPTGPHTLSCKRCSQ